jgi:hypothetical protein
VDNDDFIGLLAELHGNERWPKPFHLLQGTKQVEGGQRLAQAARMVGTSAKRLEEVATAPDPVGEALGASCSDVEDSTLLAVRNMLGQLVLGRSADLA